jgi:hypothetical protein
LGAAAADILVREEWNVDGGDGDVEFEVLLI